MKKHEKREPLLKWESILDTGGLVLRAYMDVVKAADELAMKIDQSADLVLKRALPRNSYERRDGGDLMGWLAANRENIEDHLQRTQEAAIAAAKRKALLAKLNLSKEDQKLLGILT
jgi:hypothetical protein